MAYFGDGDEFHMAFHFPLMPRMFMAIRMEDRLSCSRHPGADPGGAGQLQWAIFLRNHDELTLEMVADEERDYMYRVYAVTAASLNLGIRRRLAPLVDNDRAGDGTDERSCYSRCRARRSSIKATLSRTERVRACWSSSPPASLPVWSRRSAAFYAGLRPTRGCSRAVKALWSDRG